MKLFSLPVLSPIIETRVGHIVDHRRVRAFQDDVHEQRVNLRRTPVIELIESTKSSTGEHLFRRPSTELSTDSMS